MHDTTSPSASTSTKSAEVERLSRRVEELEAAVDALASDPHPETRRARRRGRRAHGDERGESPGVVSRRRLFGLLGGAAAAGAGLAVAGSTLGADPAGAADGDAVVIGASNSGSSSTTLSTTGSNGLIGISGLVGGIGLHGECDSGTGAVGVLGSSSSGYSVVADSLGGLAPLLLKKGSTSGQPTTGTHKAGELFVDVNGTLFYSVIAGTPGTWVNLSTGSNLVTLSAPSRVFDSRPGQPNFAGNGNTQGPLTFTSPPPSAASRTINCANDFSSGSTVVPASATALLINLTVVPVAGVGALAVYATGAAQPSASSINWFSGAVVLANGTTSACNTTQHVDVAIVATAGASTNFIIDVIGYYA
jgi:hypothetical protein